MITVNNISVTYKLRGHNVTALDKLSLSVSSGDYISVVGPSGCGKSTLLQVLGGMLTPDSGEVIMDGESLFAISQDKRAMIRRSKIGFVFQRFNLVPYLTAEENVQIPLFINYRSAKEQQQKAEELLTRVGLQDRMDHKPSELSVGQQQRVALARMLANDPLVIFADEPTGALDSESAAMVLRFFEEMNQEGRTIIMVTHDTAAAANALKTIHMKDGQVVQEQINRTEVNPQVLAAL